MSVFLDLLSLYEGEGLTVQTSLSPGHFPGFNSQDIPFTYMYRNGIQLAEGGGIAFAELAFVEHLFAVIHPRRLFVVGNAFGWSTLALAILNPDARIVAIDFCPTEMEEEGLAFTDEMSAGWASMCAPARAKARTTWRRLLTPNWAGRWILC